MFQTAPKVCIHKVESRHIDGAQEAIGVKEAADCWSPRVGKSVSREGMVNMGQDEHIIAAQALSHRAAFEDGVALPKGRKQSLEGRGR